MENFVQYWQFVTECTVPWTVHRSIHGALWWSIDSDSASFCFRSFQCSTETGNWENWYNKLYSREHTFTSFIERAILTLCNDKQTLKHTPKLRRERSKIFVPNLLSGLFKYQTQKPDQDDTSAVATTLNAPVLSTVFQIPRWFVHYYGPTMVTLL